MPSIAISPSIRDGDSFLTPLPSDLLDRLQQRLLHTYPVSLCLVSFRLEEFENSLYSTYAIPLTDDLLSAVNKRRAEFLAARVCAKASLSHQGIHSLPTRGNGKRQPFWPQHAVGSLTHSHHIAGCVTSCDPSILNVGLDIEQWIDSDRIERLASSILTPAELSFWEGLESQSNKAEWLTRIFSAKESLYKLLNPVTGQSFFFHDAAMDISSISNETFNLYLIKELTSEYSKGFTVPIFYMDTEDWVITFTLLTS